jgi:hypothetical protein
MLLEPLAQRELHLRPVDLNALVVDRAVTTMRGSSRNTVSRCGRIWPRTFPAFAVT